MWYVIVAIAAFLLGGYVFTSALLSKLKRGTAQRIARAEDGIHQVDSNVAAAKKDLTKGL